MSVSRADMILRIKDLHLESFVANADSFILKVLEVPLTTAALDKYAKAYNVKQLQAKMAAANKPAGKKK